MGVFKFQKKHKFLSPNTSFLIWKINESEEFLLKNLYLSDYDEKEFSKLKSNNRRGWLAERVALKKLFQYQGYKYEGLYKKDIKYFPTNIHLDISLSHTEDFAVACLDKEVPIGIYISKRNSIKTLWFLNREDTFIKKWGYYEPTILFSLKKAAYEAFGESFINLKQNIVLFYRSEPDGKVYGKIKYRPFLAHYITTDDYIVAWCRKIFLENENMFWVVIRRAEEIY